MITAVLTSPVTIKVMKAVVSVAVIRHVSAFARLRVREFWSFNRLIKRMINYSRTVVDRQSYSFTLATICDQFDQYFCHFCDRPAFCFKRQTRVLRRLILAVYTGEVR